MSKAGKELTKREIVLVDQSAAEVSTLKLDVHSWCGSIIQTSPLL